MRRLSIAIDARPLQAISGRRGIGRYIRRLLHALANHGRHAYTAVINPRFPLEETLPVPTAAVWSPVKALTYWDQIVLPFALRRFDLYHSTEYALPRWGLRKVITVHDFIPLHPELWNRMGPRAHWYFYLKYRSLTWADRVVTVSHAVEDELLQRYPRMRGRVRTVLTSITPPMPPCPYDAQGASASSTGMWLFVGAVEPRKALHELVPYLHKYRDAIRQTDWTFHVVGVIQDAAYLQDILDRTPAELRDRWVIHTWVPDVELYRMYHQANGLLFLSRSEGFGLPPLEALLHGCPVIARRLPVLMQLVPEGPWYLASTEPDCLHEALEQIARRPDIRHQMIQRARPYLERYHDREMAAAMDRVYEEVCGLEPVPDLKGRTAPVD